MLDYFEREICLKISRKVLENYTESKALPNEQIDILKDEFKNSEIMSPLGCFVSLKTGEGALRGCIGTIYSEKALLENIVENTINASSKDPRFDPVSGDELYEITIEISVMSPLQEVIDINLIEIGKHGLIITKGDSQGLLLPQVALEWKWDRETFLQQTCIKAGLEKDDYKSKDVLIYSFSAQVFSEGLKNENAP